jgi:hypothetical protein
MIHSTCPYCGGPVKSVSAEVGQCLYCQMESQLNTIQYADIPPQLLNEIETIKHLRQNAEFYNAKKRINYILENPKYKKFTTIMHHIYWQAFLCDYSVVFEQPVSSDKTVYLPTFFSFNYKKMTDNEYYKKAIDLCNQNEDYKSLKSLNVLIQSLEKYANEFLNLREKHSKFSIFISFKHLDDSNKPTLDYEYALKLYTHLDSKLHKKTFFSPVALKNIGSEIFEPHIYFGLYTASLFVLICTSPEYFESVWVKNEWTRYLKFQKLSPKNKNILIAIPNGFHKNELPEPLRMNEYGLERQFVYFNNDKDLIEKVVGYIEFTESSKSKDLELMKSREVDIQELDRKETISQYDKDLLDKLISEQIEAYQKYRNLFKENPIGLLPIEGLNRLRNKNQEKFSKSNKQSSKLQYRISQTAISIGKITANKEYSADKFRNLKMLVDEQIDHIKELGEFGNPGNFFADATVTDKKTLYKAIDDYKNQSKIYFVSRIKELFVQMNEEIYDRSRVELSQKTLFNINEMRAIIQQISDFGHVLYLNELPFSTTLELDNFVTSAQIKLRKNKDFIDQKNAALLAKKENDKARLEEKLRKTELSIIDSIERSKSNGYKHEILESNASYQKSKLKEYKERFGVLPSSSVLKYNTYDLLDEVIKLAEYNQKNLVSAKEREQKSAALLAKKENDKARLEEKLRKTELSIIDSIERSKSFGYKHEILESNVSYQKIKLQEYKERFGIYPKPIVLKYHTPNLIDGVIKLAEYNQKNLLDAKGREQSYRKKRYSNMNKSNFI